MNKFEKETGRDLSIEIKAFVRGPVYSDDFKKNVDFGKYEYINLIPIVHNDEQKQELNPKPYMVNFDYYFTGIDTSSWVFSKFARFLADAVEQDGYVELRMESSTSQIPIEQDFSNAYLAYIRADESEKRIRRFMRWLLIDPNRIIFTDEQYLIQGPKFDGTIPIIKFRKFQYLKIIPEKYLRQ